MIDMIIAINKIGNQALNQVEADLAEASEILNGLGDTE